MAYAKGTASDFIDFARKLRDFAAGTLDPASHGDFTAGAAVPLGQRWTILANGAGMPGLPSSGFATDGEMYLKGPGSDPADEIIVGVKTFRNAGANIWSWKLRGYTQFNAAANWDTLPGASPECLAAYDDALFDIWLYANARRIMAIARIGATDILIHLGFLQTFGVRSQYPYPLFVAGSLTNNNDSWQTNHYGHSCLPDPCLNGSRLRWIDGTWPQVNNFNSNGGGRNTTGFTCWPHRNPTVNADGDTGVAPSTSEDTIFESFNLGTGTYISPAEIGAYPLFPCLVAQTSNLIGRVDGLFVTFGLGLVKGDTFDDGTNQYDVFGNTWRSQPNDFFAVLRA